MDKHGLLADLRLIVMRQDSWLDAIFRPKYRCGHRDARNFSIVLLDDEEEVDVYEPRTGHFACSTCLKRTLEERIATAIRCYACACPILTGDGIRLRSASARPVPMHATLIQAPWGTAMVGCLTIGCADGGMSYHGNWSPEGVRLPAEKSHQTGLELIPDLAGELYPRLAH